VIAGINISKSPLFGAGFLHLCSLCTVARHSHRIHANLLTRGRNAAPQAASEASPLSLDTPFDVIVARSLAGRADVSILLHLGLGRNGKAFSLTLWSVLRGSGVAVL